MVVGYDAQERLEVDVLAACALEHEVQFGLLPIVQFIIAEHVRVGGHEAPEPAANSLGAPRPVRPRTVISSRALREPRASKDR